ncbi:hypothetical protein [Actinacidiphila bryophytorum]|jgi:hypothetical protein|uniref:hypothetical protein n=1 Tax=Actinacidiphila bryophytorum TaxID=1436133 RepID=UPI002176C2CB|nr:hypothetical protein [Actinacidiphila bryophytorum]UWE07433.1 hypothetical protein NYE86_00930 [Actinacidiphila bryophytorum]
MTRTTRGAIAAVVSAASLTACGPGAPAGSGDAQLHRLLASTSLAEADQRAYDYLKTVVPPAGTKKGFRGGTLMYPEATTPPCTTPGQARHAVLETRDGGPDSPGVGAEIRKSLQRDGWKFGDWVYPVPVSRYSDGRQGGYLVKVLDHTNGEITNAVIITPCLPGSPVSRPSDFPDEP